MEMQIKLGIVDDEVLVTKLLSDFLNGIEDLSVVLTAFNGVDLLKKLESDDGLPDIIISDLKMDEMDGVETAAQLKKRYPKIKIIVLSSYYKQSFLGYMMKAGVNAFLPKGIAPDVLLEAVRSTYSKGFFFLEEQIDVMRNQITTKAPKPKFTEEEKLTKREHEVLELICQQFTTQEIADKLFISERTVEGHRNNLFLKTKVKNVAGLVIYAVQKNLIDPEQFVIK